MDDEIVEFKAIEDWTPSDGPAIAYEIGGKRFCGGCWLLLKPGTVHTCEGLVEILRG